MSRIVSIVVVVAIAIAGYFGLKAAGIVGAPSVMTAEEVEGGLGNYADQINAEGGLKFDDWSKLTKATAVQQTVTIRGESTLNMDQLADNYYSTREPQMANKLCNDPTLRALLRGRATMNFNWFSADNESLGDMITVRGDEICGDS